MTKKDLIVMPLLFGILGALALLSIYFTILTISNSSAHAVEQFQILGKWITTLVIGFGIQIGLFSYTRRYIKIRAAIVPTTTMVASTGISTGSMVACCLHHLTDVLPLIGLSAAAIFLSQYQIPFILLGILSNIVGIALMLRVIQNHKLYSKDKGILRKIMKVNMTKIFYTILILSIIVFAYSILKTIGG